LSRKPSLSAVSPFSSVVGGVRVAVRLVPKARRNRVDGVVVTGKAGAAGEEGAAVKVAVTAVPEGGKANEAMVRLLAREWRLPKGAFEIVHGRTDRRKVVLVRGDPDDLAARLGAWTEGEAGK
jgi:uncharacterized protein YggU (UPF0235/DUF167 family)